MVPMVMGRGKVQQRRLGKGLKGRCWGRLLVLCVPREPLSTYIHLRWSEDFT